MAAFDDNMPCGRGMLLSILITLSNESMESRAAAILAVLASAGSDGGATRGHVEDFIHAAKVTDGALGFVNLDVWLHFSIRTALKNRQRATSIVSGTCFHDALLYLPAGCLWRPCSFRTTESAKT